MRRQLIVVAKIEFIQVIEPDVQIFVAHITGIRHCSRGICRVCQGGAHLQTALGRRMHGHLIAGLKDDALVMRWPLHHKAPAAFGAMPFLRTTFIGANQVH